MVSLISILTSFSFIAPLFLLFFLNTTRTKNREKLPPSPPQLPLIGNLHQLGAKSPHKTLLSLAKKYGDLMFLQLGTIPTIVVSSPKIAQEIFKNHDLAFSSRPNLYNLDKLVNNQDIAFAPYGEYWREIRKITVFELLTVKRVESFQSVREEEIAFMMNEIRKTRGPVNLSSLTFNLANTIVCRVAFDRRSDPEFEKIVHRVQYSAAAFNIADYFPILGIINKINGVDKRLAKRKSDLDEFFDKVITEHRNKTNRDKDIVDVLLNLEKDASRSINLNMNHIKGILVDVFIAGTDTSATIIVWTMTELMRNPEVLDKLQREIREIGAGSESIEEKDLPKLTYLKLVIKESLRLHPPLPLLLPRETISTCAIGEKWVIPEKTRVILNVWAMSIDPEYWEKPELFWPERFSDGKIDYKGQHFGYLPFGTGRRICPGINFGIHVVELALANLVLRYDWELPEGMRVEDIDMEEAAGITMFKKVPLSLVAKPVNR